MEFLSNPHRLWTSDNLEDKRLVCRLVFSEKLPYQRNEGFRTARTTLPVTVLQQIKGGEYEMARLDRLSVNQLFEVLKAWKLILRTKF